MSRSVVVRRVGQLLVDTKVHQLCLDRFRQERACVFGVMSHSVCDPIMSIVVTAYNHEKYIRQCLESVLAQKTTFPIEIVLGEDGSTDRTRDICIEYAKSHSEMIRLYLRDRNTSHYVVNGVRIAWFNGMWAMMSARGCYIAYLEGDDYWRDYRKLQRQFEFLEAHNDYGLVFTDADYLYEASGRMVQAYDKSFGKRVPDGHVLEEILKGEYPYKSCTAVFRQSFVSDHCRAMCAHRYGMHDAGLWLLIAGQQKVGYLPVSTAVYRIRSESASHFIDFKSFLRFRRDGYKVRWFFNRIYGSPVAKTELRSSYRVSVLRGCAQYGWYRSMIAFAGCGLDVFVALAREVARRSAHLCRSKPRWRM